MRTTIIRILIAALYAFGSTAGAAPVIVGGSDGAQFIAPTIWKNVTEPSSPASGFSKVWISSVDGRMYRKTSAGTVAEVGPDISGKLTDPMTTNGDMIYRASGVPARLAIGAADTVQVSSGSAPGWAKILNANIDTAAAIAYSKLDLVGGIVNADINASAAIDYSKLDLVGDIVNADINSSAGIVYSKLDLTGGIVNADVNASAGIVDTKLATISTSGKVANSATTATASNANSTIVLRDGSGNFSAGTVSANVTGNVTGDVTGNADTATALAANPADCASDRYATTIAANGDLTCAQVTNAGLAGSIAASKLIGTDINTVGTIGTGTWQGSIIGTTYGGTGQNTLTGLNIPSLATDIMTWDGQASAPSNPSSGFYKIWVDDTTGKPKIVNSSGTVSSLGGGAGSSGINVLAEYNNKAEEGTAFWSETGGGTFTTTTTAANVGNGLASFSFDASANNDYLESDIRTIPSGLYGANCLAEFYYKGFDSNITAQVHDGTNVIASRALVAATGFVKEQLNFICPSSGNFKLRFLASANAAIGYLDEVHLGSATNVQSESIITTWTAYTPARSDSTNNTTSGFWRRVGTDLEVIADVSWSGNAGTFSTFDIDIPSGLVIDTTKLTSTTASREIVGSSGKFFDSAGGTTPYSLIATYLDTNSVRVKVGLTTGAIIYWWDISNSSPASITSGDYVQIRFKVPIVGWNALTTNVVAENLLDTVGMVFATSAASCPSGTLPADGSAVSRTTYSQLFAKLGVTAGQGDNSTTFNVPDYRGRFVRGADNYGQGAASRDVHSRAAMNTGGNSSGVNSVQEDAFQGHWHLVKDTDGNQAGRNGGGESFGVTFSNGGGTGSGTMLHAKDLESNGSNGTPRSASETVPKNAAVIWCIVHGGAKPTSIVLGVPTVTKLTSGTSQTYTKPAAARWLRVRMVGGGGGGGGGGTSGAGNGGTGGDTTLNDGSTTYTAGGGGGGPNANNGGYTGGGGGSATNCDLNIQGGRGDMSPGNPLTNTYGSAGGNSLLGSGGLGGTNGGGGGQAAPANSGGGGGGAGGTGSVAGAAGAGSGAYCEVVIRNPKTSYTYTVGAAGSAGSAGSGGGTGGAGGSGIIFIEEHY